MTAAMIESAAASPTTTGSLSIELCIRLPKPSLARVKLHTERNAIHVRQCAGRSQTETKLAFLRQRRYLQSRRGIKKTGLLGPLHFLSSHTTPRCFS